MRSNPHAKDADHQQKCPGLGDVRGERLQYVRLIVPQRGFLRRSHDEPPVRRDIIGRQQGPARGDHRAKGDVEVDDSAEARQQNARRPADDRASPTTIPTSAHTALGLSCIESQGFRDQSCHRQPTTTNPASSLTEQSIPTTIEPSDETPVASLITPGVPGRICTPDAVHRNARSLPWPCRIPYMPTITEPSARGGPCRAASGVWDERVDSRGGPSHRHDVAQYLPIKRRSKRGRFMR